MPGRSRYAYRYDDFHQNQEPIPVSQAGIIEADSYLLNIANGQCGDIRVSCWPSPEGDGRGRRWGKLGATDVAIMPFRTRAGTASPTAKVDTFELELFFTEANHQGFGPSRFPEPCCQEQCRCHAAIHLVNVPAPANLAQTSIATSFSVSSTKKPWTFRSEEVQGCSGLSGAAKWTWDANGHEPLILHGGVAFKHVGEPLVVTCRVRGRAFTEIPNQRLRIRYQFSNEQDTPKWWVLVPRASNDDLAQSVDQLEAMIQNLNREPSGSDTPLTSAGIGSQASAGPASGHNFGSATISGPAHVVMGDIHFGYNASPNLFQRGAGWQQFNPSSGTGMLS